MRHSGVPPLPLRARSDHEKRRRPATAFPVVLRQAHERVGDVSAALPNAPAAIATPRERSTRSGPAFVSRRASIRSRQRSRYARTAGEPVPFDGTGAERCRTRCALGEEQVLRHARGETRIHVRAYMGARYGFVTACVRQRQPRRPTRAAGSSLLLAALRCAAAIVLFCAVRGSERTRSALRACCG